MILQEVEIIKPVSLLYPLQITDYNCHVTPKIAVKSEECQNHLETWFSRSHSDTNTLPNWIYFVWTFYRSSILGKINNTCYLQLDMLLTLGHHFNPFSSRQEGIIFRNAPFCTVSLFIFHRNFFHWGNNEVKVRVCSLLCSQIQYLQKQVESFLQWILINLYSTAWY